MEKQLEQLPTCFFLVGAGPGDPRLITIRALDLLRRADAVLYDSLVNPLLLLECRKDALLENVGKRYGAEQTPQEKINSRIVELLRLGKSVVRLKGGDPFLFARGAEELQAVVEAGFDFEIVPGVSALNGCTAYAGIPLTHREYSSQFHVFTAKKAQSEQDFSEMSRFCSTFVLFMGLSQLRRCCERLLCLGAPPETPVAIIEWGTRGMQRCISGNLSTISQEALKEKITQPALIVMGETVSMRKMLIWWEKKPLFGKKILLTSSISPWSKRFATHLLNLGAEVCWIPLLEIVPTSEMPKVDSLIKLHRDPSTWVLFTSSNAVRFYVEWLLLQKHDVRILFGNKILSCGVPTQRTLNKFGLVPYKQYPAGKLKEIAKELLSTSGEVVWPSGSESTEEWLPELKERLHKILVYNVVTRRLCNQERQFLAEQYHFTIFMSPSAVRAWVTNQLPLQNCGQAIAIGERTEEELIKNEFENVKTMQSASVEALLKFLTSRN